MKEKIRNKWLNDEPLSVDEKEFFATSENFRIEKNIIENAKRFKISEEKTVASYDTLKERLHHGEDLKVKRMSRYRMMSGIAAAMLVLFGLFYVFGTDTHTTLATENGEQKSLRLPDNSLVALNAASQISFNKKSWHQERAIQLNGEAFFDVEKGATFDVNIDGGKVTVLGTKFNVIKRDNLFEVSCYEGLVRVIYNKDTLQLPAGNAIRVINDTPFKMTTIGNQPGWKDQMSKFQNMPIAFVFNEFERQYDLTIKLKNVDKETLFTGAFKHDNDKRALTAITAPLGLSFNIEGNEVTIYAKNQ